MSRSRSAPTKSKLGHDGRRRRPPPAASQRAKLEYQCGTSYARPKSLCLARQTQVLWHNYHWYQTSANIVKYQRMLIFCKLFGVGVNETLSLVLPATEPLAQVRAQIASLKGAHLQIRRILFAGQELTDDARTLAAYRVLKECTLQVQCGVFEPVEANDKANNAAFDDAVVVHADESGGVHLEDVGGDGDVRPHAVPRISSFGTELPGSAPSLSRAVSEDAVQYGDAVFVTLVAARNLQVRLPFARNLALVSPAARCARERLTSSSRVLFVQVVPCMPSYMCTGV